MIIGIPKEIKDHEYRVGMIPAGVRALVEKGHRILVESGAGEGSGFPDASYRKAGARLVRSRKKLFPDAEMIVKVKEPQPSEHSLFHADQILMTYLHLAADRKLTETLMQRHVAAIAYETVEDAFGTLPLLRPMSEVAGRMSVQIGANLLQKGAGGSGILLSGVPGVIPGRVAVLGGGVVGRNAARIALGLGATVCVVEEDPHRRVHLDDLFEGRAIALPPHPQEVADLIRESDLIIGAVARRGERSPHLVSRKMVSSMRPGSVVVDVSIDQGGCFETSRPTSHSQPTYIAEGVVHYCVPNIPGVVPRTSTFALTGVTLPYILNVASLGFSEAVKTDKGLAKGVNVYRGEITYSAVAEAFGFRQKTIYLG
jgi:alanine dehydrogenase